MATIREIAELAGVSRGTVDRVLNNRGYVHLDTRARIQKILHKMNYQPNRNARALSVQKKKLKIAYIYRVTEINTFFDYVIEGLRAKTAELNEHTISLSIKKIKQDDIPAFEAAMDEMWKAKMDGLIITAQNDPRLQAKVNRLTEKGLPIVTCNVDISDCRRLAFAGCDLYKSGYVAGGITSLIVGGNAKVGIVTSGNLVYRVKGFVDAISQNHPNIHIVETVETSEDIIKAFFDTKAMMEKHPDIKAIFAETVAIYGVCRALEDLQLEKTVKVICFDDNTPLFRQLLLDGLVSAAVSQDPFWQGYRSFEILWDYLINRRMPENKINYSATEIRILESMLEPIPDSPG
jgi:LacI family transcriptional regulator